MVGHGALGEPEREHGGQQPALEATEVADSDHLDPTAADLVYLEICAARSGTRTIARSGVLS